MRKIFALLNDTECDIEMVNIGKQIVIFNYCLYFLFYHFLNCMMSWILEFVLLYFF